MVQSNLHVEDRINAVLEATESSKFPPIHHLVEELNVVLNRTEREGEFVSDTVSDLSQHACEVDAEYFEVGKSSFGKFLTCLVDFFSSSKECFWIKRRVVFREVIDSECANQRVKERTLSYGQAKWIVDAAL